MPSPFTLWYWAVVHSVGLTVEADARSSTSIGPGQRTGTSRYAKFHSPSVMPRGDGPSACTALAVRGMLCGAMWHQPAASSAAIRSAMVRAR